MEFRCFCGGLFQTYKQLQGHIEKRGHRHSCSCGSLFKTLSGLKQHQLAKGHANTVANSSGASTTPAAPSAAKSNVCSLCCRKLANEDGLRQHIASKHHPCPSCHQHFKTVAQRNGHQKVNSHCYCHEHDTLFSSEAQYSQHRREEANHNTEYGCVECERRFSSQHALEDHLASPGHATTIAAIETKSRKAKGVQAQEEASLRCEQCDRQFKSFKSWQQHKDSLKHKPLSELKCPLSDLCQQVFTSPSMLAFHFESGKCKSGMNRLKLNAVVHGHDTGRHITNSKNAANAIASAGVPEENSISVVTRTSGGDTSDDDATSEASFDGDDLESIASDTTSGVPVYTPSSRSRSSSLGGVILTPTTISEADTDLMSYPLEYDHKRQGWQCPTSGCLKTFKQKHSLFSHLNSPAHALELYHCPTGISLPGFKATKTFKTLSGFAQHIEAGACAGGKEALKLIAGLFEASIKQATGMRVNLLTDAMLD